MNNYETMLYDCDPEIQKIYALTRKRLGMLEPAALKTMRESKNISVEAAAAGSGASTNDIERWEHNDGVQSREYEAWLKSK